MKLSYRLEPGRSHSSGSTRRPAAVTPKLDCIAGFISERQGDLEAAKRLYLGARAGFRDAHEQPARSAASQLCQPEVPVTS